MNSDQFQATIISKSSAPSVRGAPSLDVSRANVDFVVGARPKFADETAALLRSRLQATTLALTMILCAAFVGNLVQGIYVLWWLRLAITLTLATCWIGLASQRPLSLSKLRNLELLVFGVVVLQVGGMMSARMNQFASAGDPGSVIAAKYQFMTAWSILILIYGVFMPNTWRRCAAVTVSIASVPYIILVSQRWLAPHVADILATERLGSPVPLPLVAAVVAAYGTHIITAARREAFKTRQFGQYHLLEKLGSGGMGEVYKAEHVLLKRPCAMKLIRPDNETDATALAHFEKEVRATAQLTHWNTVDVYDYGRTEDGTFYYVMELLPGLNLEELVERYGPVAPARVIHYLRQICGALQEAHAAGLIHRDIKPANIFATQRGGVFDVAKLLDFGLVRERSSAPASGDRNDSSAFSGTPLYMAPEQATAFEDVDGRTDLYSLGAVAYYLLTGQPPFSGNTVMEVLAAHSGRAAAAPSSIKSGIPPDLEQVVLQCLAKQPASRFTDASSLERALSQCSSDGQWTQEQAQQWWAKHAAADTSHGTGQSPATATDPFSATIPCGPKAADSGPPS